MIFVIFHLFTLDLFPKWFGQNEQKSTTRISIFKQDYSYLNKFSLQSILNSTGEEVEIFSPLKSVRFFLFYSSKIPISLNKFPKQVDLLVWKEPSDAFKVHPFKNTTSTIIIDRIQATADPINIPKLGCGYFIRVYIFFRFLISWEKVTQSNNNRYNSRNWMKNLYGDDSLCASNQREGKLLNARIPVDKEIGRRWNSRLSAPLMKLSMEKKNWFVFISKKFFRQTSKFREWLRKNG